MSVIVQRSCVSQRPGRGQRSCVSTRPARSGVMCDPQPRQVRGPVSATGEAQVLCKSQPSKVRGVSYSSTRSGSCVSHSPARSEVLCQCPGKSKVLCQSPGRSDVLCQSQPSQMRGPLAVTFQPGQRPISVTGQSGLR